MECKNYTCWLVGVSPVWLGLALSLCPPLCPPMTQQNLPYAPHYSAKFTLCPPMAPMTRQNSPYAPMTQQNSPYALPMTQEISPYAPSPICLSKIHTSLPAVPPPPQPIISQHFLPHLNKILILSPPFS